MKNFILFLVSIFTLTICMFSCKGNEKTIQNKEASGDAIIEKTCDTEAIVVNYTGLSSCRYLLRLEDGSYISPNNGVKIEDLMKSKKVKIGYVVQKDVMSSCMKGKIANITCFEILEEGSPEKGDFE